MGRYRSRSRSYSPRRGGGGAKRYDEPRDNRSRRDRRSPAPSGLLIRNISLDARPEDLRIPFERFGPIKDVYLPKDYYTGDPRGFGFVKFRYGEDAAEAKQQLNHTVIGGREIRIVFAEENRKTPQEMRRDTSVSDRGSDRGSRRRRSPPRSPRRRHGSYSRSPSPARSDLRERGAREEHHSSRRSRSVSRSISPRDNRSHKTNQRSPRQSRSASRSHSPRGEKDYRSPSPRENGPSPHYENDIKPSSSQSLKGEIQSPPRSRSRSYSPR